MRSGKDSFAGVAGAAGRQQRWSWPSPVRRETPAHVFEDFRQGNADPCHPGAGSARNSLEMAVPADQRQVGSNTAMPWRTLFDARSAGSRGCNGSRPGHVEQFSARPGMGRGPLAQHQRRSPALTRPRRSRTASRCSAKRNNRKSACASRLEIAATPRGDTPRRPAGALGPGRVSGHGAPDARTDTVVRQRRKVGDRHQGCARHEQAACRRSIAVGRRISDSPT